MVDEFDRVTRLLHRDVFSTWARYSCLGALISPSRFAVCGGLQRADVLMARYEIPGVFTSLARYETLVGFMLFASLPRNGGCPKARRAILSWVVC